MTPEIMAWAHRHHLSHQALHELRLLFGLNGSLQTPDMPREISSEDGVKSWVRHQAAQVGILAWRNNVGAMEDVNGRVVRFGLANDSKNMNKLVKSSDLIGIRPDGKFWARECKPRDWQYTGTEREIAQLKFLQLVTASGGDAAFTTGGLT